VYDTVKDPYCYKHTAVLRNRLGLRDQAALDAFEAEATAQRFTELLPTGRLGVAHYRAVHKHLFGDVFSWAGRFRSVRIAKASSMFCYPEHIASQMARVFGDLKGKSWLQGLSPVDFSREAAHFLAELNAIHPFRDGNGRTQLAFVTLLAFAAGHKVDFDRIEPESFLAAMIESFHGREESLALALQNLISLKNSQTAL
jgi:cell filamentation protein